MWHALRSRLLVRRAARCHSLFLGEVFPCILTSFPWQERSERKRKASARPLESLASTSFQASALPSKRAKPTGLLASEEASASSQASAPQASTSAQPTGLLESEEASTSFLGLQTIVLHASTIAFLQGHLPSKRLLSKRRKGCEHGKLNGHCKVSLHVG